MVKVRDVIQACHTGKVRGLSLEIIDELNLLVPNALVNFADLNVYVEGDQINPFLQPPAKKSLIFAINERGKKLVVNSAYRTVAQQYLLRRQWTLGICSIPAAAPPGLSNHESGLALDIEDAAGWESSMERHGFLRLFPRVNDPPHFDYNILAGTHRDLGSLGVKAFQRLWNKNNPNNQIAEDGAFGPQTEGAILESPIDGFKGPRLLRKGDQGENVRELQKALNAKLGVGIAVNGVFDQTTEDAIKQFQQQMGIGVDGIVGPQTRRELGL